MLVLFKSSQLDLYDWCLFLCASRPGRSFTVRALFVFLSGVGLASCTCKGGFSGFLVSPRIPTRITQNSQYQSAIRVASYSLRFFPKSPCIMQNQILTRKNHNTQLSFKFGGSVLSTLHFLSRVSLSRTALRLRSAQAHATARLRAAIPPRTCRSRAQIGACAQALRGLAAAASVRS